MNTTIKHPRFPEPTLRRAARWAAKQIGLDGTVLRTLTVEVGYRRSRGGGGWGGWYHHRDRRVQVLLPRAGSYPTSMANNRAEREEGREANDEWELFVAILAHELEHARAFAVSRTWEDSARLNHEPRVRAVDHRVMLAFRAERETLLPAWTAAPAPRPERPAKPQPTAVERRAARAEQLLAQWERKLRMAKTKVAKYRRKVGYYQRAAATRGGDA